MRQLDETSTNQILEIKVFITHRIIPRIAPGKKDFVVVLNSKLWNKVKVHQTSRVPTTTKLVS